MQENGMWTHPLYGANGSWPYMLVVCPLLFTRQQRQAQTAHHNLCLSVVLHNKLASHKFFWVSNCRHVPQTWWLAWSYCPWQGDEQLSTMHCAYF